MVQVLGAYTRVVEYMERGVLNELLLRGRGLGFVGLDPRQNLLFSNLHICRNAPRSFRNHVGNSVAPGRDSRQHLVRCNAAILPEAIVAIDGHTNVELGLFELAEVDAGQRILMSQIDVDVRVNRRLSSTCQLILRAMAVGAVLAKKRIESVFESCQRPRFVKPHLLCVNRSFDVDSAPAVRYFGIPASRIHTYGHREYAGYRQY